MQKSKTSSKIARETSEANLTVVRETARVHEAVNTQMQSMERPEQVDKLSPNDRQAKKKGTKGKKPGKERKCYRCGGTGHLPQDKSCPALNKTCNKCGKNGHFADCCKKNSIKKTSGRDRSEGARRNFESEIHCEESGEKCVDEFTVVEGHGKALLGKDTAEKLNVLRVGPLNSPQAYSITSEGTSVDIVKNFADVFCGVGKLKHFQLKLHVNKDIKPVAQPVRGLPFGLRDKVDKKLDELLKEDIIEEVPSGPTEWVSPLMVVPKPDGDKRVCVDMRRANQAIERERHPIPTFEEVLHDVNGSTAFSKLDLKWGFHQVELETESRRIITFITQRGLFQYKRLMFGITSTPEKYQKIVKDVLIGCKGVANIADY